MVLKIMICRIDIRYHWLRHLTIFIIYRKHNISWISVFGQINEFGIQNNNIFGKKYDVRSCYYRYYKYNKILQNPIKNNKKLYYMGGYLL